MTNFNPELDGWALDEAIMRSSDPEALAALAHVCTALAAEDGRRRLPPWWRDELAPALSEGELPASDLGTHAYQQKVRIERAFLDRLSSGELVGWGRYNSPVAPHTRIPADAWSSLRMHLWPHSWSTGVIAVETITGRVPVTHLARVPVKIYDEAGNFCGWRTERQPRQELKPTREITLRLYAVRIQPPSMPPVTGKSASENECFRWLRNLMAQRPDDPKPKQELAHEARGRWGLGRDAFMRAWRKAVEETGSAWDKPGRRRKSDR